MARPAWRSTDPTKPLLKAPVRIGSLDTPALIGELRQLHEDAQDAEVGRMPANEELYRALLHLEERAGALKSEEARRQAAITRVQLWEYLREQAEIHQARAVADARAANAEWTDLVPALAVKSPSAAYNKATRLRAAALTADAHVDRPVRRTPEAVREVERQAALRAVEERRAEARAARRHRLIAPVAQRLLEHRAGLDDGGEVTDWLNEIAAVLPDCRTPTQLVSLETYVGATVRGLRRIERTSARPAATTTGAQLAFTAAAELFVE